MANDILTINTLAFADDETADADVLINVDNMIDFTAINLTTGTSETDLRIEYETNPNEFIQNYGFDLGRQADTLSMDDNVYLMVEHIEDDAIFGLRDDSSFLRMADELIIAENNESSHLGQDALILAGIDDNNIDTFYYDEPYHNNTISGFINVGSYHDKVDLSALLNTLGAPDDLETRANMVHLSPLGDDVKLTLEGLPEFSLVFANPASSHVSDFVVGMDIIVS